MRKVIVNSTPLIALCKVNQLELLRELYTEITIPEAVFQEVTAKNDSVKRKILENGAWIHVQSVSDTIDRRMYKAKLHDGEVEVMILAQEIKADLVIIDDNAARKTAVYLGLPLTGTVGVLLRAKAEGLVPKVMPIVDSMEQNGLYYGPLLKEWVRNQAKE
jgi:predicted nucleic acid-binding protein